MKRTMVVSLIVSLILLSVPQNGRGQEKKKKTMMTPLESAILAVKPSVVQIVGEVDSIRRIVGSGFFINGDGLVLTASHVADVYEAVQQSPGTRKNVYLGIALPDPRTHGISGITVYQSFYLLPFTVLLRDRIHDVAILKPVKNPFAKDQTPIIFKIGDQELRIEPGYVRLRKESVRDGEEIGFSGYPLARNFLVNKNGIVATSEIVLSDEELRALGHEIKQHESPVFIAIAAMINQGLSGSPLFDMEGRVVGICKGHVRAPVAGEMVVQGPGQQLWTDAGIGLVVPIKYAVDLMEQNSIHWYGPDVASPRGRRTGLKK
jgi:S1-C subfamily serine protease